MVSVTADQVRMRLGLSSADIADEVVTEFADDAASFLGGEIGKTLDCTSCSKEEAAAIRNLAAVYCFCHVTGGSAVGLNFSVGSLRADLKERLSQLEFLLSQVERFIGLKRGTLKRV